VSVLPIIRTARADEDLIAIWAYIAAEDLAAADRVVDAIEARWVQLARHPYSGMARAMTSLRVSGIWSRAST
jgi:toxin ParE1/3/4